MPGRSTPMMPMLAPARTLPANRPNTGNRLRRTMPPARQKRISSTLRSAPIRRARRGASGANNPRQSTGAVVSRPAAAAERPVSSRTWLSRGRGWTAPGAGSAPPAPGPAGAARGVAAAPAGWFVVDFGIDQQFFRRMAGVRSRPGIQGVSHGSVRVQISSARLAAAAASGSPRSMASSSCWCSSKQGWALCGSAMVRSSEVRMTCESSGRVR